MKKNRNHVVIVGLIVCVLMLTFSTGFSAAAVSDFSDMPAKDYWSYDALASAVDNGLLNGSEGKLYPAENMTRAELAAITVRAFGAYEKADISVYTDLAQNAWYVESIQKAVGMGILNGYPDQTMRPNAKVTRQEAFTVVSRVLLLTDGTVEDLAAFADREKVSTWAVGTIAAMVKNGYVAGSGGSLYPQSNITRQEFAQLFYNCFQYYYAAAGTYSKTLNGNAIINHSGVTLSNITIDGDLFVAEGSAASGISSLAESPDQKLVLDNVKITGRLVIRDGANSSILMKSNSRAQEIVYADGMDENVFAYMSSEGLVFNVNTAGTYTVVDYNGIDTTVTIPETYRGVKVTAVAAGAFADDTSIETIVFPVTLTSIADGACNGCTALANLQFAGDPSAVAVTKAAFKDTSWYTHQANYTVTMEQKEMNDSNVTVTVDDGDADPTTLTGADEVKTTGRMVYNDTVMQQASGEITLAADTNSGEFDIMNYGKFTVHSAVLKDDYVVAFDCDEVGISADEYNLAPINATFPVIYFTLSLWDINHNTEGEPIPTFVMLERSGAYDWDKLPANVYGLPNVTNADLMNREKFHSNVAAMVDYVADLNELNPDAKYHLYINDRYPDFILKLLTANKIDESQYDIKLLSDGDSSYSWFNNTFNVSDPYAKYDAMADCWEKIKQDVYDTGTYDIADLLYNSRTPNQYEAFLAYDYVVANEDDNTEWWLARTSDTLNISNAEFLSQVVTDNPSVKVKSISTMLTALTDKGDTVKQAFKDLYRFNDEMFSEAQEQDKKVMMFLGTKIGNETNFGTFAKFIMAYYGDEYIYYYKGHPGTPTNLYPDKVEQLEDLGITDVNSSIAAELILYFYPDIYMCGYQSSTYQSVSSEQMACALFNTSKAAGAGLAYGNLVQMFLTTVDSTNATYGSLCPEDDTCALVEFKDTSEHDIAIWDATTSTITYYKNTGTAESPIWTDVTPE
ncbi:MAG TPA: S-layer homology domain-containing protein [Clostridiales bacterium]|nr:S-layer homology domain-containing protein [Clostridiales bacterium]